MYFKFGHGEAKALSFCVMTTVPKHSGPTELTKS